MNLAEKILHLRKLNGMSQEELATKITVSRQAISKWELGESVPDTDNVIQLCKLFGVSADYLLNDDVGSDMDIPVVRKTQDKIKKKYNRILVFTLAGLLYVIVSLIIISLTNSFVMVIYGIVGVTIALAIGMLIVKLIWRYAIKRSE